MLEKLMDADDDMHAMHLIARAYDQLECQVSTLPLISIAYANVCGLWIMSWTLHTIHHTAERHWSIDVSRTKV